MDFGGIHIIWMLTLMIPLVRLSYQAENILYPFGESEGDTKLPQNDDGDSGKIQLLIEFPYFDEYHDSLIVNTNGIISFIQNVSQYTPDVFPLDDDRRIIAPYWADADLSTVRGQDGRVWYRQTAEDFGLLQNLTEQIGQIFRVEFRFRPFLAKFAFVATWENVTFYSITSSAAVKTNTFQAVLVSDGDYSFTIFNYDKLEWTTGSSSFGNKGTGLAGNNSEAVAAQVGFNAGDGSNYYSVPGSRTDAILAISHTSNILVPGRWVFRIDGKSIKAGGCTEDATQLQISPQQVSMLGGDVLSISGPCFQGINNIVCRIEGVVIDAIYDAEKDPFTVRCSSPIFMLVGLVDVELSKDGGRSFNYTGRVSVVGLDQIEPSIAVEETSSDILKLTWNADGFPNPDSRVQDIVIDILLYFYEESTTTGLVRLAPARRIRSEIRLANDQIFLPRNEISEAIFGRSVGIFRITEKEKVNTNISNSWINGNLDTMEAPIAAMWSLPFNLNPDSSSDAARWCETWALDQIPFQTSGDNIPPCPCLMSQALADISVFERYPWCNQRLDGGCEYRQEAVHCVRARVASKLGRGQLCCYGADGNLMHLKDTPEGGYTQKHHHSGFVPARYPGNIPYLSNYLRERIPWEECCGKTQTGNELQKRSCDLFRGQRPSEPGLRPSDDCKYYITPTAAAVFGEPHIITFDGKDYIFNGYGEYALVVTKDTTPSDLRIEVQGRMEQINETVLATGLTAVAIKSSSSSTVQIELNERREMDAWIRSDVRWNLIDFVRSNFWIDNGLTIELGTTDDDRKLFSVTFDQGIAVVLEKPPNSTAMSIRIYLPPTLKERVLGLLGTWNNDSSDDFTSPSGRIVSGISQMNLHNFFGQEWNVNADETLFRYDVGLNYSMFNNATFTPNFDPLEYISEEMEKELHAVCGDNKFCRYDYHKTGNPDMGRAAEHAHITWERTRNQTTNVVSCGYLPPPENGSKVGVVYLAGSVVNMSCNDGFELIGTVEWTCSSQGSWTGNEQSTCVTKKMNMWLILYIIMAIVAFLILISTCLICFVCIMRRRKDREHDRERSKSNAGLSVAYQNGGYAHDGAKTKINGVTPTSNGVTNANGAAHRITGMTDTAEGVIDFPSTNGHAANGHPANGHASNGHAANGYAASSMYGHAAQPSAPPLSESVDNRTLDAAVGVVGVAGGGSTSSASVSSPDRPAQPSTSRSDQPSTSSDTGPGSYKSKAPPIEKKLKKKAKENPYDALPASFKAKTNNPDYETLSRYRKDIPALMEEHSDEEVDEIAIIKEQVRREMAKERGERH